MRLLQIVGVIQLNLILMLALLGVPSAGYAADSTQVSLPVPAPVIKKYTAKVNNVGCVYYVASQGEMYIYAQNGVGSFSNKDVDSCPVGYAPMGIGGGLTVRERHLADPGPYHVLRAISMELHQKCCPIFHVWE